MGAARVPRWNPHDYDNGNDDGQPAGTFDTKVLIIEEIDEYGNTIVVIDDYYLTLTSTIPPSSPLPTAATTSDPSGLLQKEQSAPLTATPSSPATATSGPSNKATSSTPPSTASTSPGSGYPSQTAADTQSAPSSIPQQDPSEDHHGGPPPIGAMVVAPIAVIAAAIIIFMFWRRRRAAKRNAAMSHEKTRSTEDGLSRGPPGYNESTNGLLMTPAAAATPLSARTTRTASNQMLQPSASRATRASQQPVILNTNMSGGAYFTGIDTSDAVSLASAPGTGNGPRRSFDVTSVASGDEPPPPYRPRSVPPISRETSLRNSAQQGLAVNTDLAAVSEANNSSARLGRRGDNDDDDDDDLTPTAETSPMRNPFEHPDDDAVSAVSTPTQSPRWVTRRGGGDEDARSMISEFSFEHEHR